MWSRRGPFLSILLLLCLRPLTWADSWPIQTQDGAARFVLHVAKPGQAYYLVVGSPQPGAATTQVSISAQPTALPAVVYPAPTEVVPSVWLQKRQEQARQLQRTAATRFSFYPETPVAAPPRKSFHLLLQDKGLDDPKSYQSIAGNLVAQGKLCQVYLDADEKLTPAMEKTVAYLVHTFDTDVQPWARAQLGEVDDVDRDGRFTIFLTARVRQIPGASASLQGFVRSSDFLRDMQAPFSNQCDMMVLRSDVEPGPHLLTLLVHEYTHAVVFCEHYLNRRAPLTSRRDEESWLGEGLAHVAETLKAQSWSNLDYRISAYLSSPESYRLVVADYFQEKLWRNPGTRGVAYLFLRWCHEQKGIDLLGHLVRSNYHGVDNLEIAMQRRFDELFREWSVAQVLTPFQPNGPGPFRPLVIGPYLHDVDLQAGRANLTLVPTAVGYAHLHAEKPGNYLVRIESTPAIDLQLTLVAVPAERRHPRTHAHIDPASGKLHWRSSADWKWQRLDVSPRHPGDDTRGDEYLQQLDADARALELPAAWRGKDVVLRLLGEDEQGRRVTSWAR